MFRLLSSPVCFLQFVGSQIGFYLWFRLTLCTSLRCILNIWPGVYIWPHIAITDAGSFPRSVMLRQTRGPVTGGVAPKEP